MSLPTRLIKPHKHIVYLCDLPRKEEMLKHLIAENSGKKIVIVSENNSKTSQVPDTLITLTNDEGLSAFDNKAFDLLISFDLPSDPERYIKRLEYSSEFAFVIADEAQSMSLYPIELLLKRSLIRQTVAGFETQAAIEAQKAEDAKKATDTKKEHREFKKADDYRAKGKPAGKGKFPSRSHSKAKFSNDKNPKDKKPKGAPVSKRKPKSITLPASKSPNK